MDFFFSFFFSSSIFSDDYIIVGGTLEEGNYSTEVSAEVQQTILERAREILPQIQV